MTTSLQDMKGGCSGCCGAQVYIDQMICSDCKEHCDLVEEESQDFHTMAGLTPAGVNEEGEEEWVGTRKQWDEYERLLKEQQEII